MAHLATRSGYARLVERLNRPPQGAPPSALLDAILKLLFDEREADLVSRLPIRPFGVETAARCWQVPPAEAQRVLEALAGRGILLDYQEPDGRQSYTLPPPMAGFLEFSLMRVRGDLDQALLAELLYHYIDVEDAFVRDLFVAGETRIGRVFVQEPALPPAVLLQVLDWEKASACLREATCVAVGLCYCRHKMLHLGRACPAPLGVCLTLGDTARSLVRHGIARQAEAAEALDLVRESQERGLVQFGDNVRERVSFLCNCCGCCCEAMLAARRFGFLHPVQTSNWMAEVDPAACNGCGRCLPACPVWALALHAAGDAAQPRRRLAVRDARLCLGCGACVRSCPRAALRLQPRRQRTLSPLDTVQRVVLMAIERGRLQELVFDDRTRLSHRALAAVLGVILRLPPVKRALASGQLRSRYLEALLARHPVRARA